MLGVLGKTSLVLILCVSISFKVGLTCFMAGCNDCWNSSDGREFCEGCTDGYIYYQETCSKKLSGAEFTAAHCADCTFYNVGGTCEECEAGYILDAHARQCNSPPPPPQGGCFPGNAMVTTSTGNVAMETLNIGDQVLTEVGNSQLGFTKVVGFAQREPGKEAHFMSITAVNQAGQTHTVKLTTTHNIFVKTKMADDHDEYIPRFAEDVLIGNMLKIVTGNGTDLNEAAATHVTLHKEMGVYAPLTETGTMLVDGTLVSCYASINDYISHLAMTPIRWFPWMFSDEEKPLDGRLPYVESMKYIARNYVAPIVTLK